ncbi:MAG TPA: hypothetical protein VFB40_03650, partial [Actinocrinis sp.]|nr:hypothetical protein [Actinocrinis sp.]
GCPFAPRCESVFDPCHQITPPLRAPAGAWPVACHLHDARYAGGLPGGSEASTSTAGTAEEGGR